MATFYILVQLSRTVDSIFKIKLSEYFVLDFFRKKKEYLAMYIIYVEI